MKIAIVGTSKLDNEDERAAVVDLVEQMFREADEVITGDAEGVDYIVRNFSDEI